MEEQAKYEVLDKRHIPADVPVKAETSDIVIAAINKGYDPAFIEKMMDLEERRYREEARRAFYEAVAAFKAEAPAVKKDKYNKYFDSWYTSLGNLLDTYNPILGKHGLSVSFPTPEQTEKSMSAECRLSHRMGHSDSMKLTAPIDQAAIGKVSGQRSRNAIQDIKSTFTYLRSATCEGILGVSGTEASQDDDGNSAGGKEAEFITEAQAKDLTATIEHKRVDVEKFLAYMGVEEVATIQAKDFNKACNALKKAKGKQRED
ncbi:MAG: ERF family protein [Proteobacteria bacterium]|nr:ERF family protein [Pseudomonadota bacterium]